VILKHYLARSRDNCHKVTISIVTIMQTRTTAESILAGFEAKEYNLAQIDHERAKFSGQCGPNRRRMAQK